MADSNQELINNNMIFVTESEGCKDVQKLQENDTDEVRALSKLSAFFYMLTVIHTKHFSSHKRFDCQRLCTKPQSILILMRTYRLNLKLYP